MGQLKSVMEQIEGTTNLRIDQNFDADQLLVKLSRNGAEWLSPKGWVKSEKGTLLDCKKDKDCSIVEIPAEFAKKLKNGDKVSLSLSDQNFTSEIIWGQRAKSTNGATNGSGAHIKTNGAIPSLKLSIEETEKRAKEAEKAAADYRAQMEAAAKAREEAQTAALEAARKADEALKAEADRIAEMEQASKAFEEAEKLRRDEQRRLDMERRLEEERIAEEARLAEEARVAAEAERIKKERREARKFFKGEISQIKDEKSRLNEVLEGFKTKAEAAETDIIRSDKRIARVEKALAAAQKEEADYKAALSKDETALGDLKAQKQRVLGSITSLNKNNEKIFKNLERVEAAHKKALSEVEAAKTRAAEALSALTTARTESETVKSQNAKFNTERDELSSQISVREKHIGELKITHEKTGIVVENERKDLKDLKREKDTIAQRHTSAKTDISRTLQDIQAMDDKLKRKKTALKQIEDMENADDIRLLTGQPVSTTKIKTTASKPPRIPPKEPSEKGGLFGRFFRKAGKDNFSAIEKTTAELKSPKAFKSPETKVKTHTVALKSETAKSLSAKAVQQPIAKAGSVAAKSDGVKLNSWLLLGAAALGLTALGTTYALSDKAKDHNTASAPTNMTVTKPVAENPQTTTPQTTLVAELTDIPQKPGPISMTSMTNVDAVDLTQEVQPEEVQAAKTTEPVAEKPETKSPKPEISKPQVSKPAAQPVKKITASKPAPSPAPRQAARQIKDYTAVTRTVQEQLTIMGLYSGDINGQQTIATQDAIQEFKTLFDLPVSNELNGAFLNTLNRAVEDREAAMALAPTQLPVVQVAETTGNILYYEPETTSLPVSDSPIYEAPAIPVDATPIDAKPLDIVTETNPVQVAEVAPIAVREISAPVVEDVIVPAKVISPAKVSYPSRLLRKQKYFNARVKVSYDVSAQGEVLNPVVKSVDFDGPEGYQDTFERAAIKAVKTQKFKPRTINGEAATEASRTTRIVFNFE